MDQMVNANIALDIFSIILSLIPVVYLIGNHRYRQKLNRYFLGVSVSNVFMIIGDLADWVMQDFTHQYQKIVLSVFSMVFYVASAFVLYFFARYMDEYLKLSGKARTLYLTAITAVCSVQAFFAVISPFTGSIFYVTGDGYQRGGLFWISQVIPLFCYISFTVLVIVYRKKLTRREVLFFLLYIFIPLGGGAAQMLLRGIAVVNIGVALALLFILVNIQFENELTLHRREQELAQARINIMLSQIQPHFLYNSLTVISHLCTADPAMAKEATQEFSRFLRANIDSLSDSRPIPFDKELEHVRNYLSLEQKRFGDRLHVLYDIQTSNFILPSLSLQPLAENAVRHGIMRREEGGALTIASRETESAYLITIADDGVGFDSTKPPDGSRSHIGLQNVRSRLQFMCKGTLQIDSTPGSGTVVTVTIPKVEGNA